MRPEATHPVHAGQHGNRADIQLNIYLVVSACSEQDAVLVCRAMPERWACCPLPPRFATRTGVVCLPLSPSEFACWGTSTSCCPLPSPSAHTARLCEDPHKGEVLPLCSEDVDLGRRELAVRVPYVPHEFSVRPSGHLRFGHAGLPPSWTRGYRLLWGCLPGFASHDSAQRVAPSRETIAMKMRIKGRAI